MKRIVFCSVVVAALCGGFDAVEAGDFAHTRNGFYAGFAMGAGNATWDWDGLDGADEGSGTLHLRFGSALRDDLLVGFEGAIWSKRWDISDADGAAVGELTLRLVASTFALTYYPGNIGVSLRAGFGIASAFPDVADGVAGFSPETENGMAVLGGIGYEWRVTDKFAFGPEFQVSYLAIDGDVFQDPLVIDGSVQFNWYW